ncbi:hypothetical protein BV25DRAFT_1145416 [Artomyces pyxidatus]|uniref:Uncharacterized protein n=1 Tax=Artomyces pyxidatus TaxID=48021 RepID=A0ACB8STW8_9AGAM|nr:hypothetical protein BV25DRAFT_1145416 [Artomyces pyxidatus]
MKHQADTMDLDLCTRRFVEHGQSERALREVGSENNRILALPYLTQRNSNLLSSRWIVCGRDCGKGVASKHETIQCSVLLRRDASHHVRSRRERLVVVEISAHQSETTSSKVSRPLVFLLSLSLRIIRHLLRRNQLPSEFEHTRRREEGDTVVEDYTPKRVLRISKA